MQAVTEGFGGTFTDFKYDSPDYRKLSHLEENVYQFSYAKDWHMLRDLTDALKDGDKILPFKEWNEKARQILGSTYEGRYKQTEYYTAITSGQMASKSMAFDKHPNALIQYRAVDDGHECPICQPFNNTVRPWSDSFWQHAMPPNHFGCRCNTVELNDGEATPDKDVPSTNAIPSMFRTNLARSGMVFPEDSSYYINIPKDILQKALEGRPYERRFETIYRSESGGSVSRHMDVDPKGDKYYPRHFKYAKELADQEGVSVQILPVVTNAGTRKIIYPDIRSGKNPDLKINGEYVDVKNPEKMERQTIKRAIGSGFKQADHVLVDLSQKFDDDYLRGMAKGEIGKHKERTVRFRHNGKYQLFNYSNSQ